MPAKIRFRVLAIVVIAMISLAAVLDPEKVIPYIYFVTLPLVSLALLVLLLWLWRKENDSKKHPAK